MTENPRGAFTKKFLKKIFARDASGAAFGTSISVFAE
jgi:hypothetical protein